MSPVPRILCAVLAFVGAFLMGLSIICSPLVYAGMQESDSPWCGAAPFIYGACIFAVSFLTYACMGSILSRFEARHAFWFALGISVLCMLGAYVLYLSAFKISSAEFSYSGKKYHFINNECRFCA